MNEMCISLGDILYPWNYNVLTFCQNWVIHIILLCDNIFTFREVLSLHFANILENIKFYL